MFCGLEEVAGQRPADGRRAVPAAAVGLIVLPLMLFHQIQLMVCAFLARRYAMREEPELAPALEG